ncbi:MAG: hypothetical protein M3O36_00425 [Myxococcota bacterium]|nr:hypothetical protein [Myxococcota bacterium]
MHSSLRQKLNELATHFTNGVLDAIRTSPIEELFSDTVAPKVNGPRPSARHEAVAPSAGPAPRSGRAKGGRLPRRSSEDISGMLSRIVTLLRGNPNGLRAEQIRAQLGVSAKELPRPLAEGLSASSVRKTGQKRATTYFAAGAGRAVQATRGGQKTSRRAAARRAQVKKK